MASGVRTTGGHFLYERNRTHRCEFGNIDIYVFDQLLRGRIAPGHARVRRRLRRRPQPRLPAARRLRRVRQRRRSERDRAGPRRWPRRCAPAADVDFRVEPIEHTSFPDDHADVVMASAVLHFARDDAHFEAMLRQMWRVLKPGGVFFARLASTIGIESRRARRSAADATACPTARIASWSTRRPSNRGRGTLGGDAARSDQDHRRPRAAIDDDWVAEG